MEKIIGLDGHSKTSFYVLQDEFGDVLGEARIPTTLEGLAGVVEKHGLAEGTRVAMEPGPCSELIADFCWMLGLEPVIIHAQEVRALA